MSTILSRSLVCAAVSAGMFSAATTFAATLTLRQGLDGYTGTRDDAAKQSTPVDQYVNLDDGLYAYSTISGPYLGTVVGFDISGLPAGATINSATLKMTFPNGTQWGDGSSQTWVVKNPTAQWVEGQVNYWFAQNTGQGVLWNSSDAPYGAGGTGITMANNPTVISSASTTAGVTNLPGTSLSFDVTSLVNGWYTGSENRGIAVLNSAGANNTNLYWAGKANATDTWRPTLVIDYTPAAVPEPASLGLLAAGGLLLRRRRTH